MVTALRQKIGELNGRYSSQRIDFDLHESKHLKSSGRGRLRTSSSYMVVIQNLNQVGDRRFPNSQAMQGLAPSAPMQTPQFQQGVQQQAQPYQQPYAQAPQQQSPYAQSPYQQPYAQAPHQQPGIVPTAAVAQAITMMTVTCPDNAGPGSIVQIQTPSGGLANVQVPANIYPGQQFQVQV